MTKTLSLDENISIETVLALTRNGDEVVIEENGEPLVKVTPIEKPKEQKPRVAGLGKGYFMSNDFDDELPDEFWALIRIYEITFRFSHVCLVARGASETLGKRFRRNFKS